MDPFSIISLVMQYGTTVKSIIDAATNNDDIVTKVTALSKPLASLLETVGGQMFPNAKPQLHIAAGALAAFDRDGTKWLQGTLNSYLNLNPPLVVDGNYGPKTKAAVVQAQTQLGVPADGWAGKVTLAALELVLKP